MEGSVPPPAVGVRLRWPDVPERGVVETRLGGRVVTATSSPGGFSPGVAARLRTLDGHRVFVKAAGPEPNPDTPAAHRREAEVAAALPPDIPAPRLLWSYDEGEEGWIVLAFEDVAGHNPAEPWRPVELDRVLDALAAMAELLTPSPLLTATVGSTGEWSVVNDPHWRKLAEERPTRLDAWSLRHLPVRAEEYIFIVREGLQPAPPGLPTLRAFQAAQGEAARSWLVRRTGWK